jgi:hypothetical protein
MYFNNFHYKKLFNNIYLLYYKNISNKNIVVLNGGGLITDDSADLKLGHLLLKHIDYNIINIKYPLMPKNYNDALNEVIKSLYILINNINIDVFISDSMGSSLLLHALDYMGPIFKNSKMIFISPLINFDLKPNSNMNKDFLDFNETKKILYKYKSNNKIDYVNLPKSLIIAYSNEMFYFDIINFYKKLNNSKLLVEKDCTHADIIHYAFSNKKSVHKITDQIIKFILN